MTSDLSGMLHVLDGRTGRDLPGWPQPIQIIPGQTVAVRVEPDGRRSTATGKMTIIVGAGSLNVPGQQGGVEAFNANGTLRWRIRTQTVAGENGVVGTPAVGDVNGDGHPDVVFGSSDHGIYAVNRFGQALPGFPYNSLDTIWDSPALYDEAHIGRMDIFLGGDASPGGPCGSWSWAGVLRAIRVTPTGPKILWSHCQHQIFQSSPAIGDLEGNGRMDLVVGTGTGPSGDARRDELVERVPSRRRITGARLAGLLNGPIFGSPVIGDVTGDRPERCGRRRVRDVQRRTRMGVQRPRRNALEPVPAPIDHTEILSTPILVDLNGDGVNDVAVGRPASSTPARARTARSCTGRSRSNRIVQDSAAVADFGPGFGWRLDHPELASRKATDNPRTDRQGVESFPLPKAPTVAPAWPQWRLNPRTPGRRRRRATGDRRVLARRRTAAGSRLRQRALLRLGRRHASQSAGRRHGVHAGAQGLLARHPLRRRARVRRRASSRLGDRRASRANRSSASHAPRPERAIGWSRAPAACSRTATPSCTGRAVGAHLTADRRHRADTVGQRLLARHREAAACSRSATPVATARTGSSTHEAADRRDRRDRHRATATGSSRGTAHVFTFGDAHSYGSRPTGTHVPIVALTPTPSGHGYWLVGQTAARCTPSATRSSTRPASTRRGTSNSRRPPAADARLFTGLRYSLRAISGPVMRSIRGRVAAMIPRQATRPTPTMT